MKGRQWINTAQRLRSGEWLWYDQWGKDYGPFLSKKEAVVKGKVAADREEKLLRLSHER